MNKVWGHIKRSIWGRPTHRANVRFLALPKRRAFSLFGADSVSSVAYAPDEIILMLSLTGAAGLVFSPLVAIGIALTLLIVVGTYRYNVNQISEHGEYELVLHRLGPTPALAHGASSMVDYVLTVAVAISAATHYLLTIFPHLVPHQHYLAALLVIAVTWLCIRGLRFTSKASMVPTYAFLGILAFTGVVGIYQYYTGTLAMAESSTYYVIPRGGLESVVSGLGLVLLLARAFSSGAVALTGVSTINSSAQFFAAPQKRNVATVLMISGFVSSVLLLLVMFLVHAIGAVVVQEPEKYLMVQGRLVGEGFRQKPLLYQVAETIFSGSLVPVLLGCATVGILLTAACTAFAGFPLLTSSIAENKYLPVQMRALHSARLHANSVLVLGALSVLLVFIFGADINALIQMYIVGVFTSMCLTQSAILRHRWQQLRVTLERFKRRKLIRDVLVTSFGLVVTAVSMLVVLLTKLTQGAWVSLILILLTMGMMTLIRHHYDYVDKDLMLSQDEESLEQARALPSRVHAVVYIPRLRKPAARALAYARASRASTISAVAINVAEQSTKELLKKWDTLGVPVPLTILDSPYRDRVTPLIEYIRQKKAQSPRDIVVVYLPEYVITRWWERSIHRRTVHKLAQRLRHESGVVIAHVPWSVGQEQGIIQ
ncbi:APC family permease [Rothia sp. P6271]|uniref:APC family permease n=1 Tax=Rothia sp. P6271 TaxID=3402659 RepID=UPI003AD2291C